MDAIPTYPPLSVLVEKGEQTYWLHEELVERWKKAIVELEPGSPLTERGIFTWERDLADLHPALLPPALDQAKLPAFRQQLLTDVIRVMRMLEGFQRPIDNGKDQAVTPGIVEDGIESYADYHERFFLVEYRERPDYPYWSLLRLTVYAPVGWLRVHNWAVAKAWDEAHPEERVDVVEEREAGDELLRALEEIGSEIFPEPPR